MTTTQAQVLFRPESPELRFLPEGPQVFDAQQISWVSIQHGDDSEVGAINIFDLDSKQNRMLPLSGRPGFAFPASDGSSFMVGIERHLYKYDIATQQSSVVAGPIDATVSGTIINDAEACEAGIIFGAKDLQFAEKKAGLYFWRRSDSRLFHLRDDQICSNGKVIMTDGPVVKFLDIDTPTKKIVSYSLDTTSGRLSDPEVVVDVEQHEGFPDGMVATPDGRSVIVAVFNPDDVESGEARQYSLSTGQIEHRWITPLAPRVTCPLLLPTPTGIKLILTTAVEGMQAEQEARCSNSGSLFIADTPWS